MMLYFAAVFVIPVVTWLVERELFKKPAYIARKKQRLADALAFLDTKAGAAK